MFHPNALTLARRSALPLAVLCALGVQPTANAATIGLCHYLTNTTIQNVSGHDLGFTSQTENNFTIQPSMPAVTTYPLILSTGGVTGFSQTWGTSSQKDVGAYLGFTIKDGKTNPQFQLHYWSGVGSSPGSIADALMTIAQQTTEEAAKDAAKEAALEAAEIAVPPPADAIIAAIKKLKLIYDIAKDIADAFQALGYLNINPSAGNSFSTVSGVSVDTNQAQTVVIPGQSGSRYNGYVVSAISVSNGCPNSWNVSVSNYCSYICGYASGNNVPVADTGCLTNAYCTSTLSSNPLPGGSYADSCTNAKWKDSSTLAANCKDSLGSWHDTEINYYQKCAAHDTLSNTNGALTCD